MTGEFTGTERTVSFPNVMRFLLLFVLLGTVSLAATAVTPTASVQIDGLLASIGGLRDAVFVRNGSEYDAVTAEKFLRAKWARRREQIHSAAEFIEQVASVSSTSGQPYRIRFKDGREVTSSDFLRAELARLEAKP